MALAEDVEPTLQRGQVRVRRLAAMVRGPWCQVTEVIRFLRFP